MRYVFRLSHQYYTGSQAYKLTVGTLVGDSVDGPPLGVRVEGPPVGVKVDGPPVGLASGDDEGGSASCN